MKRKLSYTLCLLFLLLPLCAVPASAQDSGVEATVSVVGGVAEAGKQVDVTLVLSNSIQVSGLGLDVTYDRTKLELCKAVEYGSFFTDMKDFLEEMPDQAEVPQRLLWVATSDTTLEEGIIAKLTFRVLEDTEAGECPITVNYTTGRGGDEDPDPSGYNYHNIAGEYTDLNLAFQDGAIQVWKGILPQGEGGSYRLRFASEGVYCAAALYSEDRQLKELHFDTVANSASVHFTSWKQGDRVSLMLLDGDFRPLCPAASP